MTQKDLPANLTPSSLPPFSRLGGASMFALLAMAVSGGTGLPADPYFFVTLAGKGSPIDHPDGAGSNARLLNPTGVAVDASGNIFIADGGDHTIRKVTP